MGAGERNDTVNGLGQVHMCRQPGHLREGLCDLGLEPFRVRSRPTKATATPPKPPPIMRAPKQPGVPVAAVTIASRGLLETS